MLRKTLFAAALCALLVPTAAMAQDEAYTLGEVLDELSDDPERLDAILARMGQDPAAAAMLSPTQKQAFRQAIRRQDWRALDGFPTMSVPELGRAIRAAGAMQDARRAARMQPQLGQRDRTLQNGGLEDSAGLGLPGADLPQRVTTEALGIPTGGPGLETGSLLKDMGQGLQTGDRLDPEKAARYADSSRLAEVLNRLALNDADQPTYQVTFNGQTVASTDGLISALQAGGQSVEVRDARYFANFGDVYMNDREVETPFYIDTEIDVPGTQRSLTVPAVHSQHEVIVRGDLVNADVSFFFGIDGQTKFRPMAGQGQSWTAGRVANSYEGERAVEAVRLAGAVRKAYAEKQERNPDLPFGGYHRLGVCNDSNALVEMGMTGKTTLYPLTRDRRFFQGSGEVDELSKGMPRDSGGTADLERVLGSLPVDDLNDLAFPRLRSDLGRVLDARGLDQTQPVNGLTDQLAPAGDR